MTPGGYSNDLVIQCYYNPSCQGWNRTSNLASFPGRDACSTVELPDKKVGGTGFEPASSTLKN